MLSLALVLWPIGEIGRAISLVDAAEARIAGFTHVGTRAFGTMHSALFEMMRRDLSRASPNVTELARLAREHDLPAWRVFGLFFEGWAKAESGAPADGLEAMGRAAELLREQNIFVYDGLIRIALAENQARSGDVERAVAVLDEALATCERIDHRTFEAELHRARGDMLLKRDPADAAPAEAAFVHAIEIASGQGTRSFALRAALSLARLYHSIGRPVEADAVLAPALDGFPPTTEMPEIAEAQALLTALAATDEVKADATRCSASAPLRRIRGFQEGRISGSS
jgi:predicted ATPase